MALKYNCINCGTVFNPNNHNVCPNCRSDVIRNDEVQEMDRETFSARMRVVEAQPKENFEPSTMDDLVAAQNRTTHAVRSLAITFVASPIIMLVVFVVIALAIKSGNVAIIIIAALIGLLTLIGVLIVALDELRASRI